MHVNFLLLYIVVFSCDLLSAASSPRRPELFSRHKRSSRVTSDSRRRDIPQARAFHSVVPSSDAKQFQATLRAYDLPRSPGRRDPASRPLDAGPNLLMDPLYHQARQQQILPPPITDHVAWPVLPPSAFYSSRLRDAYCTSQSSATVPWARVQGGAATLTPEIEPPLVEPAVEMHQVKVQLEPTLQPPAEAVSAPAPSLQPAPIIPSSSLNPPVIIPSLALPPDGLVLSQGALSPLRGALSPHFQQPQALSLEQLVSSHPDGELAESGDTGEHPFSPRHSRDESPVAHRPFASDVSCVLRDRNDSPFVIEIHSDAASFRISESSNSIDLGEGSPQAAEAEIASFAQPLPVTEQILGANLGPLDGQSPAVDQILPAVRVVTSVDERPRVDQPSTENILGGGVGLVASANVPSQEELEALQQELRPAGNVISHGNESFSGARITLLEWAGTTALVGITGLAKLLAKMALHPAALPVIITGYFSTVYVQWRTLVDDISMANLQEGINDINARFDLLASPGGNILSQLNTIYTLLTQLSLASTTDSNGQNFVQKIKPRPVNYVGREKDDSEVDFSENRQFISQFPTSCNSAPSFYDYLKAEIVCFDPRQLSTYLKIGFLVVSASKIGYWGYCASHRSDKIMPHNIK